ncbi:segregation/condensation protein A [candidate division WOR-3 bacterium]|nr:segregation/condensation protein A [candidate division WOR-3 bacterium]
MSPYRILLPAYEGPVDLLLYFVKRDKLDVLDIPVARLADEFIAYVETIGADIEELAEFLLMATVLLYWKMRVLLRESVATEEQIEEPVSLTRILEDFARYRETAGFLAESREANLRRYPRGHEVIIETRGDLVNLLGAFHELLERERPLKPLLLTRDDWGMEDATAWLYHTLSQKKRFRFFETMRERRSSVFDMLVLFLTVLEQLRLNRIKVTQPEPFADFLVETVDSQEI